MLSHFINNIFGNSSGLPPKTMPPQTKRRRSRVCRMEELESRELLSVTLGDFDAIRSQYADLDLSASMSDYNVIEILADELSESRIQSALSEAATTSQDDLIVIRTNASQNTLTLNGNPLTIEIDSSRFGTVAIVTLSDTGSSLLVDTQCISRAFRINSGVVAMGGIEIVGQTWSFDIGSGYDGLIAVRGQSALTTSNVRTWAMQQPAQQAAAEMFAAPAMMPDALMWEQIAPGVWDSNVWDGNDTVLAAAPPYGSTYQEGTEYMIGNIYVTLVLMESNGAIDTNQLNWTPTQINNIKAQIRQGLDWWETMFDKYNPGSIISLSFFIDYTWTDAPFETSYEPITRDHKAESLWVGEFLTNQGYTGNYSAYQSHLPNLRKFNHAQRETNDAYFDVTDWSFSIFIVNSRNPAGNKVNRGTLADDYFAYAWMGGPNLVMTYDNGNWGINDMSLVMAHEVGHIFWALDEYKVAGTDYYTTSGYYNIQNTNSVDNRPGGAPPLVDSIMASGALQTNAFDNHTSSQASLEMIGWRDSNGNGILDVLDVPMTLTTLAAYYDEPNNAYLFAGRSSVATLPNNNKNPGSTKKATTLNTVDNLQYKLDDGEWRMVDELYGTYGGTTNVNAGGWVRLNDIVAGAHTIAFRTICERTGVVSEEKTFNFDWFIHIVTLDPPEGLTETSISTNSITLVWDEAENATGYILRYKKSDAIIFDEWEGTENTAVISGLDPGAVYEFQVRAVNADGSSVWSDPLSVATDVLMPPKTPVNLQAAKNALFPATTIDLSWNHAESAEEYEVEIKALGNKSSMTLWIVDVVFDENTAVIAYLNANTEYQFRVRAVNAAGVSAWSEAVTAKTDAVAPAVQRDTAPPKPRKVVQENKCKHEPNKVELKWDALVGTVYVITYTIPSGISGIAGTTISEVVKIEAQTTEKPGDVRPGFVYTIDGLKQGTYYKISIAAKNADTGAAADAISLLTMTAKILGPTRLAASKVPGEKTTISSITLTWMAPAKGYVSGYRIEVWAPAKTQGTEPTLVRVIEPSEITGTKYLVTGLQASTKYMFRVIGMTVGGIETAAASKVVSTARYAAVWGVKAARNTANDIVLNWKTPIKPAPGAENGYINYQVYWLPSNNAEPILVTPIALNGSSAVIEGAVIAGLKNKNGQPLDMATRNTFIIRAVIKDGETVVNRSLDVKFSFVPNNLRTV